MMGTPINVKRRAPKDDISQRSRIHTSDMRSECNGAIKLGRQIQADIVSSQPLSDLFLKGTLYRVAGFTPFGAKNLDFEEEEGRAR
jgi:hypothetical protein